MHTSESIKSIAPALHKAQSEMKSALKDSTNPHFRSKYADLSSVVEAVKSALHKNGLVYVQGVEDAEGGVAIETRLIHVSGEWIASTLRIPASKQDAQGYGSAITYGRRYGLQAMCGVPAEDDDGNAATATAPVKSVRITPTEEAFNALTDEEKATAKKIGNSIIDLWNEDKKFAAYEAFYESNLPMEMQAGVWHILGPHSKMRAELKAMKDSSKERKAA